MFYKNENVVIRRVHDMNFLINITDNYLDEKCCLYELNEIGLFIWNALDTDNNIKDITNKLIRLINDDVCFELVLQDVSDYLEILKMQGLIKEIDE